MAPGLAPAGTTGGACCAERYEELRRQVLSGDSRGMGLAVLLGRGLKAWLDVAGALQAPGIPPQPLITATSLPLGTIPAEWRSQLAAVLAGMVLHGCPEWRTA